MAESQQLPPLDVKCTSTHCEGDLHAGRDRVAAMRDPPAAAADSIQVIVPTCHPDDYEVSGVPAMVDLSTCVTRPLPRPSGRPPPAEEGGAR